VSKPSDQTKSEAPLSSKKPEINPAVKSWLDNVLIPAMVERYMAENRLSVERIEISHHEKLDS
jgi:hypothetical protein